MRDLTAWAERHGAVIGMRPSKTTRLVITTDAEAIPSSGVVAQHQIPVLAPDAARQWLQQHIATHTAQPAPSEACAGGPLIFAGPGAAPVWRLHELPHELTAGTFTAPVRWLAEQAAAPAATFVQFIRTRAPRLTVDRSKAPRAEATRPSRTP